MSKDGKVILENFLSLGMLQSVNLILPLIVLPYMIQVVGFERYGIIVLAASLVAYFTSVTDYSFKITATRDVAVFKNSKKKLSLIYSKVLSVKVLLMTLSWLIIGMIVLLYPPFYDEKLVFICSALMLLGYMLFPDWYFQGIEKMKYIALLNVSIKIFFTISVFVFVRNPDDYWKYSLLNSGGYIGAGLVGQYIIMRKHKIRFIWLTRRIIKHALRVNFPIFINQFIPNLYNNTSTFLLGLMTTTYLVGIYDAIKKIIDLGIMIVGVISRVFFPFLNRNKNRFKYYRNGMLVIGGGLTIMPIIFHDIIFRYLSIEYDGAFGVLVVLSLGIYFYLLYDVFGVNYLIVNRKDKIVMKNTISASLIGALTALPLISYFGIFGAALNLTISRLLMGGGVLLKYKREKE